MAPIKALRLRGMPLLRARAARTLFEIILSAAIAIALIAPFWPDK